jgi:hemolysin activation/secretion protein
MRSRSDNLFIFGNFVYNEIQTDILGEEYSKDKITKFELGGQYAWRDNILWGGGIGKFNLTLHQGVDLFDATSEEDISSRINASSEFTKIVLEGERRQIIDENFSFVEAFKGQYSFEDNLLASEEFGIGGRNYLRGFDPSEELGEHGFALKLQVEYQDRIKSSMLKNYTLYTFAEYGKVYDDTGLDEEEIETELASVGLGAKFSLPLDFMFEAEVAKPIIGEVKTEGDDDARFFFSLSKNF